MKKCVAGEVGGGGGGGDRRGKEEEGGEEEGEREGLLTSCTACFINHFIIFRVSFTMVAVFPSLSFFPSSHKHTKAHSSLHSTCA